jgi:hypothetical protein
MVATAARPLPLAPPVTGAAAGEDLPPYRVPASHFLVALAWLVCGSAGLVLVSPSLARGAWLSPGTAATVHAFTLGWLVTSAYGALYQLAPVVLGVRPKNLRLAPAVLLLHTLGTGLLVTGLGLWNPVCIAAGWTFVAAALAIWTWNIGVRIAGAPRARLIAAHITAAYAAFWITLGLAGVRIGNALGWWMVPREPLVAAHVQLAAVGFAGVLVMGLGSRLFPMFLMNRNASDWPSRWCGAFALAGVLLQVSGWLGAIDEMVWAGGVITATGAGLFLLQAARWVRSRARRTLDHPLQQLIAAFFLLAATLVVGLACLAWSRPQLIATYGVLLIVGSITLVIGAVYGRVLPFLTWLERYSPRAAGRVTGPKATELLPKWSTGLSTGAWAIGAVVLAAGTGAGWPRVAVAGAVCFAIGSITGAQQYLRLVVPALRGRARSV